MVKPPMKKLPLGFTLIELLVVLAIIGTLLSLVAPRYSGSVDKTKEIVLKQNLATLRDAIDKHLGDTGKYPASLNTLVVTKYLKRIPFDPVTDTSNSWIVISPIDPQLGAVADVKSGAPGRARDGTAYRDW